MDERFEALCEIGELVISGGRSDLIETYYDLLCEHYPVELLTAFAIGKCSSEEESEEEGPPLELEPEPEPPLKEMGESPREEEEDKLEEAEVDYGSDGESDMSAVSEEDYEINCDKDGFLSLA